MRQQNVPQVSPEFVTQPSGYLGWMDRNSRGYSVLELSLYSRARLARENNERIINEWRSYLV